LIIKEFNLKFSIKLQWPFTFKKNDEKDQPHVPKVSEIQVSSTHHEVTTTEKIKIDSDGVRFTKKSGYTEPDKRYMEYWENKETTGSNNRTVSKKPRQENEGKSQRGVNYFKIIELKHDGISEKEIAEQLNISQPRVNQLWNEYIKNTPTHKKMYSKKAFQNATKTKLKRYTHYDKKFIIDAVTQALNTSRTEVLNRYNLPETTLRQWIRRYEQSIQENKE